MLQGMLFVTETQENHITRPLYQIPSLAESVKENCLTEYGKTIVFRICYLFL